MRLQYYLQHRLISALNFVLCVILPLDSPCWCYHGTRWAVLPSQSLQLGVWTPSENSSRCFSSSWLPSKVKLFILWFLTSWFLLILVCPCSHVSNSHAKPGSAGCLKAELSVVCYVWRSCPIHLPFEVIEARCMWLNSPPLHEDLRHQAVQMSWGSPLRVVQRKNSLLCLFSFFVPPQFQQVIQHTLFCGGIFCYLLFGWHLIGFLSKHIASAAQALRISFFS